MLVHEDLLVVITVALDLKRISRSEKNVEKNVEKKHTARRPLQTSAETFILYLRPSNNCPVASNRSDNMKILLVVSVLPAMPIPVLGHQLVEVIVFAGFIVEKVHLLEDVLVPRQRVARTDLDVVRVAHAEFLG